jgi:mRNA-degrading endonuclease RelE of RelBE toxin-antitoxin system
MNCQIEVKPAAEKYYLKLGRKTKARIREALCDLENVYDFSLHPKVRALTGRLQWDYRLRVGKWRIFLYQIKRIE